MTQEWLFMAAPLLRAAQPETDGGRNSDLYSENAKTTKQQQQRELVII
ncbi:hypothetical protein EYF80_064845 [Liparis tanakae]|uniref:Uncharacterized protein n=1 Tax=Liparis tanakae TaxID=230148 RepID=A0A4Z2E895_9TELE|nr:hypothetical protein EYF80_064845 [Liparis tanakae]